VAENNYLLGYGESLATSVDIIKGGNVKAPPYDFAYAKERLQPRMVRAIEDFGRLPAEARPGDQVVGVIQLHPRYVSKSDQPDALLDAVGLYTIGSRMTTCTPERMGVPTREGQTDQPTDELFVAGSRGAFDLWNELLASDAAQTPVTAQILGIEDLYAFTAEQKLKTMPTSGEQTLFEVVLQHGAYDQAVVQNFIRYATTLDAGIEIDAQRRRAVSGLTFIPVLADTEAIIRLAAFSFVRVARAMPRLRPLTPTGTLRRSRVAATPVNLPDEDAQDESSRVVIFDGGVPIDHGLRRWVTCIDPPGIGPVVDEFLEHGVAVTSALLFGPLPPAPRTVPQPLCIADHVRVLDERDASSPDYMCYDALGRILGHLDSDPTIQFVNISLGPDVPINDQEITAWTAELDRRFARSDILGVVAVGNEGLNDPEDGLHRVQPPGDGVNILAVGAADSQLPTWSRAGYSSQGPGRQPGLVKPDGLAFGGSETQQFSVLTVDGYTTGTQGTSFAAPFTLRGAVAVYAQMGNRLNPLAIRTLMIHRAEQSDHPVEQVGWGKFESDPELQITCDDDEAIVVYQGLLNPSNYLRVPIALPTTPLTGKVTIRATAVITPDTDPAYAATYTRNGIEVTFRPDISRCELNPKTGKLRPPKSKPFFTSSDAHRASEIELRQIGHKWEPCIRSEVRMLGSSLNQPHFDVYYHHRHEGSTHPNPLPLPYAIVISVKAPRHPQLYNEVVRAYQNLVPLRPQLRLKL
jgi:Subtilase family